MTSGLEQDLIRGNFLRSNILLRDTSTQSMLAESKRIFLSCQQYFSNLSAPGKF